MHFELALWERYQLHPDTWPSVQRETMILVFLGFTLQHAFVRRWFVPVAMWRAGYMLYRALVY